MKKISRIFILSFILILAACSSEPSLTEEQQAAWDLIEARIEEGYETWSDLYDWSVEVGIPWGVRVEGERPTDELLAQMDEFGLVGTYLESEPGFGLEEFGNEDEIILLVHFEDLSYNTDVRALSELDKRSEEVLTSWLEEGGLERLEENFAVVEITALDEEREFLEDDELELEFIEWMFVNTGIVSFENSGIMIGKIYRIVEPTSEEIQAMVIERLNEMDRNTPIVPFGRSISPSLLQLAEWLEIDFDLLELGSFGRISALRSNKEGESLPGDTDPNEANFYRWDFTYEINESGEMILQFELVYDIEIEVEEEEPLEPVTLSTGEWEGGTDVPVGRWVMTTGSGSGNFVIWRGTDLRVNEILGDGSFGITSVTTDIAEGDEISISGLNNVTFTPVMERTTSTVLSTGHWVVGEDIEAGSFDVTTPSGSGNFVVWRGNSLRTNEILGDGSFGVEQIRVNLSNGDRISISGLERVYFE